jgi:hypothetical protein
MIKYFHFNKKRYDDRRKFTPNPRSIVVCDVRTGNIYSVDVNNALPTWPNHYSLGPFNEQKIVYFKHMSHFGIHHKIRETLKNKSLITKFTDHEYTVALAALDRYEQDPIGSLTWPYEENSFPAALARALVSGGSFSPVSRGASYEMVPALHDPGPEILPGPPIPMRWVNGKGLVQADQAPPLNYVAPEPSAPGPMARHEAERAAAKDAGVLGRRLKDPGF